MLNLINNKTFRSLFWQGLVIAILLWMIYSLFTNTIINMEARGLRPGFDFIGREAGFAISFSLIDYQMGDSYGRVMLVSLLNTLLVAVLGIVLSTILGFIIGVMRLSSNWLIARMALVYIEVFRNIPLLVQILFWYFAALSPLPPPAAIYEQGQKIYFGLSNSGIQLPALIAEQGFGLVQITVLFALAVALFIRRWAKIRKEQTGAEFPTLWTALGLLIVLPLIVFFIAGSPLSMEPAEMTRFRAFGGFVLPPELLALVFALVVYTAAFIAEIVRSGLLAVPKGQNEAAYALGLRPSRVLRFVTLPQALRVIVPPLTSQYLNVTKNSSLAAFVGFPEIVSTFAGTTLNQTGRAVEVISLTMLFYLSVSLFTSLLMNLYNRSIEYKSR